MVTLVSIVSKPLSASPATEGYTRLPQSEARLVAGYGIEGDAKGGGSRQLNIMSAEIVEALASEGFQAEPGQLGEQLILSGVDVNSLAVGTRLRIGETAAIELTEPRTGCAKFERYQHKLKTEAAGRLGMMARVIESGAVSVGSVVSIVTS